MRTQDSEIKVDHVETTFGERGTQNIVLRDKAAPTSPIHDARDGAGDPGKHLQGSACFSDASVSSAVSHQGAEVAFGCEHLLEQ